MKRFQAKAGEAVVAIICGAALLAVGVARLVASPFPLGGRS